MATTGLDLRLKRVAADIRQGDLAKAMGVPQGRVSYLEGRRVITPEAEQRYLAALATLTTKPSEAA